jgi:hypothetical protein
VLTLLVIGPRYVFPQYLWWGPIDWPVGLALGVITLGALWLLRQVGMVRMAASFLIVFTVLLALFTSMGRSFVAVWHPGPVAGTDYWLTICLSPEVLVFVFFMMSDPRTAPGSQLGRVIYGAAVAAVSAALLFPQPTEFGVKVGLLSGLTVVCAMVPLIELISRRLNAPRDSLAPAWRSPPRLSRRLIRGALKPQIVATGIIAVAAPLGTTLLLGNPQVMQVEEGIISPQ